MIIYLPHSFIATFEKDFKNYHLTIDDFCKKLQETSCIHIKNPIYKFKFYIKWIAVRWFILKKDTDIVVPLCIFLKSSIEGNNLLLTPTMSQKIEWLLAIYEKDFTKGAYII